LPTKDLDVVNQLIHKTLLNIANNPRCTEAIVVVAIEGCSGDVMYLGPTFRDECKSLGLTHVIMHETNGGKNIGVPKTKDSTRQMVATSLLYLSHRAVCIPSDCVAISSSQSLSPHTMADETRELNSQFMRFRIDATTGKISGKAGPGVNDDLILTFLMCIYWGVLFYESTDPTYMAFKKLKPDSTWERGSLDAMVTSS
jgi:hypothetical protein